MATVKHIYALALAKVFEAPGNDEDYDAYSPLLLEGLLLEALPYENQIRKADGREPVTSVPEISAIDDTAIDWDDRLLRQAVPYGLASVILSDDESRKTESVLNRNEFLAQMDAITPAVFEDVEGW